MVSLHSAGWPGTNYVAQAGLLLASALTPQERGFWRAPLHSAYLSTFNGDCSLFFKESFPHFHFSGGPTNYVGSSTEMR
jgi:hypothetical protein